MPSCIEHVRPGDAADGTVNDLLREAEEGWYGDAAYYGAMAHQPALFKRMGSVIETFPQQGQLSPQTRELVWLKITEVHQCAYCTTV